MHLSQYKDAFAREYVDGGILLELDDKMLTDELGMTSRMHRLRVMMLVHGKVSVEDLLSA